MRRDTIAQHLALAPRGSLDAPPLCLIGLEGNQPASDEAREPWMPAKYGAATSDDLARLIEQNVARRDLVHMLTFVLPSSADRRQMDGHVETHQAAPTEAGAPQINGDQWIEGFRCDLKIEAIAPGSCSSFAAQFTLAYLTRINATIERLLAVYWPMRPAGWRAP